MARLLWQQRQDIGPSKRTLAGMAYLAATGRTLLFGGVADADRLLNDTWEWDGEGWVQLADTGPSPRRLHLIAFDSARNVAVLFGGYQEDAPVVLTDTWEWDGDVWTQIENSGPKLGPGDSGMAYDSARKVTVLSGGSSTWSWDGNAWTQDADTGPSARQGSPLAYDPERQRTVLFSGYTYGEVPAPDTWEWDGVRWEQIEDIGPAPRYWHSLAWSDGSVLLFGGAIAGGPDLGKRLGDTWAWDGVHWRQRQDIGPAPRAGHAMAGDSARKRVVLFGGYADDYRGDTWEAFESP